MSRKQSLKLQISFKENYRDLDLYNFLNDEIKDTLGISTYLKMLIEKDSLYQDYKLK
ncbi:MAG: circadian clock-controlled protein [Peptostreptococcaceae bacterium]|nr:circadian clock-controlled protein [Peptostreptococcaceae bacterium]MBP3930153.1 circadian clock-controlled protein [Peptostreptococcaceae bacterium]